jgi:ATP-dependent helicase/nuclease subunit B
VNNAAATAQNYTLPQDAPRIVALAPQLPMADQAAAAILAHFHGGGDSPEALTQLLVLVPTRRAARTLREALLRRSEGRPLLLPRIQPIGEAAEDEMIFSQLLGDGESAAGLLALKPAMELAERQLRMTELLKRLDKDLPLEQTAKLALALLEVLDECARHGCSPRALQHIVPEELAQHWQRVLQVLEVIWEGWPQLIADSGAMEPVARRDTLLRLLITHWERHPPEFPVISIGSFGTQSITRDLLACIARLPHGLVLLSGVDEGMSEEAWEGVDETNHAYALKQFFAHTGQVRRTVQRWPSAAEAPEVAARVTLWQEALLPASCTEQWRSLKLDAAHWPHALEGMHRITAPSMALEAEAIALLLREVLEVPGKTAALVTPNRQLAAQVQSALAALGVVIDDSAGMPLLRTPAGRLVQLVCDAANARFAPVPLLAMLRHPLVRGGMGRSEWLNMVRRFERWCLRGLRPAPGLDGLRAALAERVRNEQTREELENWLEKVCALLAPLEQLFGTRDPVPLTQCIQTHLEVTENLATTAEGEVLLWEQPESESLARALESLKRAAAQLAPLSTPHYPPLLVVLLAGEVWRPRYGMHPRLQILSAQDARMQQFDRLILGGLNEGIWPQQPDSGPWMSRPMRKEAGLAMTEESLGAQSLDFLQLALAPEVYFTSSAKQGSSLLMPSRYLQRLDAVLQSYAANGMEAALEREEVLAWAESVLHWGGAVEPAEKPAPKPPVAHRPRGLAVTRVDRLLSDPYSIYAMYILGLRELDALDLEPEATQLGRLMHTVMEELTKQFSHGWDAAFPAAYDALAEQTLAQLEPYPLLQEMARTRFGDVREWLLPLEQARRTATRAIRPEQKISHSWESTGGAFTLSATVDRLEEREDSALTLVDYKSTLPKARDIVLGKKNQLPLEGWMVSQGAWPGYSKAELELWELKGTDVADAVKTLAELLGSRSKTTPEELFEHAGERVQKLIEAYDQPDMPYRAVQLPTNSSYGLEYAHLARMGEWE